jgi:hypothetical protein
MARRRLQAGLQVPLSCPRDLSANGGGPSSPPSRCHRAPCRFPLRLRAQTGKAGGTGLTLRQSEWPFGWTRGERGRFPLRWPARRVRGEQGGPYRGLRRCGPPVLSGGVGWRRGKPRICREMHEPDAVAAASVRAEDRREQEFPLPAKRELPLPANLRNAFPRRTPFGRASAVRPFVPNCYLLTDAVRRPEGAKRVERVSWARRPTAMARCLRQRDVPKLPETG